MVKTKKWVALLATLTLVGALFVGCSNSNKSAEGGSTKAPTGSETNANKSTDKPVDGGTLTFSSFSDIVSINPIYIDNTASADAAKFVMANLYDLDRKGNLAAEPWSLAAELPKVSEDGKTYEIKLKKEAKWSDGQPVTADDVIFTIDTFRNPKAGSPGIGQFDKVDKLEKIDDQTVKITLKQVFAPFQYSLFNQLIPYHVLKDVKPEELKNNAYGKDPAKTVTNGTWKWTEWKQKQYLTFEKDPNYWGQQPHIDKVVYKIYADQNTEVQALIKGDVDMVQAIPVTQVEAVKKKQGLTVLLAPGPQYEYVAFNFKPENFPDKFVPFTGVKTRQAIATALNREGMINNILKGTGTKLNAPFLPNTWADPGSAVTEYKYDPEAAKKLLAEDGWVAGSDGILAKDGHRFSFELQYNAGNSRRQQVATVIQQNLKEVGIEVKPKAIDFSSWADNNLTPGKFPAVLLSWSLNNPDPDGEQTFSSKYFPPNGQNMGWYKNEKLDKLWVDGYSTVDQAQRKKIYEEVGKEISTDLPYVFLYQYGQPQGLGSRVKFAEADAPEASLPYGAFFHIQNWWVTQ